MAYGNGVYTESAAGTGGYVGGVGSFDPRPMVAPPRPAMITTELMTAEKRLEELHGILGALEARLSQVMQPEPPSATGGPRDGMPTPSVPIAAALMTLNVRLGMATARVQSLLDRLEV